MKGWNQVSLSSIGEGKAVKLFSEELSKVIENLIDEDRSPTDVRKINIEFTFKCRDDERKDVVYTIESKSKLAPLKAKAGQVVINSRSGELFLFEDDIEQPDMFD